MSIWWAIFGDRHVHTWAGCEWIGDPAVFKRMRLALDISQEQLARKAGVKKSLIADVERRGIFAVKHRMGLWRAMVAIERERKENTKLLDIFRRLK